MKVYLLAILGSGILIFLWILFWPTMTGVISSTNATVSSANMTGLNDSIRFTPLFLWLGILTIPLLVILGIVMARRKISA